MVKCYQGLCASFVVPFFRGDGGMDEEIHSPFPAVRGRGAEAVKMCIIC